MPETSVPTGSSQVHQQEIEQRRAELEEEVADHGMSKSQEVQALRQFVAEKHALDLRAMEDFVKTLDPQSDAYKKFLQQMRLERARWVTEDKKLNREATADIDKQWDKAIAPISQGFDQALSGVIQGTQTLQQAMGKMAQSIALSYAKMLADVVKDWIVSHIRMPFTTKATETATTASTTTCETARTAATAAGTARAAASRAAACWAALCAGSAASSPPGSAWEPPRQPRRRQAQPRARRPRRRRQCQRWWHKRRWGWRMGRALHQ
jgi:cell division septum initiation protein DivIVA